MSEKEKDLPKQADCANKLDPIYIVCNTFSLNNSLISINNFFDLSTCAFRLVCPEMRLILCPDDYHNKFEVGNVWKQVSLC